MYTWPLKQHLVYSTVVLRFLCVLSNDVLTAEVITHGFKVFRLYAHFGVTIMVYFMKFVYLMTRNFVILVIFLIGSSMIQLSCK